MTIHTCAKCDQPVEWDLEGGLCQDHWEAFCNDEFWKAADVGLLDAVR